MRFKSGLIGALGLIALQACSSAPRGGATTASASAGASVSDPSAGMSGSWSGAYSYGQMGESVPFTWKLECRQGFCKGISSEPNTFDDDTRKRTLHAVLSGKTAFLGFEITKTYESVEGYSHSVVYRGEWVGGNPRFIRGEWTLEGGEHGRFTMTRVP